MNEENNIELPKRIDEIPSSPEPNNQGVEENPELKVFSDSQINNDLPQPVVPAAGGVESTNIFAQNNDLNNQVIENSIFEPVFEPISNPVFEPIPEISEPVIIEANEHEIHTISTPVTPEEIATPENNSINESLEAESVIPTAEVVAAEPLNKKLVVEEAVKNEKVKGNPVVGFFALLLILAVILAAFYYFIKMDYIKLPDEIKNKIPFLTTTTTTTTPVNNNDEEEQEDLNSISVLGDYLEADNAICPEESSKLALKNDNVFTYSKLMFDESNNNCNITELTGNYTAQNGNLTLMPTDNPTDVITATYKKTAVTVEISIPTEDGKTIFLYDINQR